MRKKVISFLLSSMIFLAPTMAVKAYSGDIIFPTSKSVIGYGKIRSQITVDKESSIVNPWMYVDVRLDATKAKQKKYNYAELALKRALGFFDESKLSLKDGDFYIILNNGFVIDKNNYNNKKVTDMAIKEILDKDFYRCDTIFKLAFLYHDNAVERTTYWKLIDTIDLPAGSSHTLNKTYTVGANSTEELNIGQAFGLKFVSEIGGGIDFAPAKLMAKLNNEINLTASKLFKKNKEIKSSFESVTNISYNASDIDKVILRYQLVDNYKVDNKTFKDATSKLIELMNQGGISIVTLSPTSGEKGIDVPMNQIFDVTIPKTEF